MKVVRLISCLNKRTYGWGQITKYIEIYIDICYNEEYMQRHKL